MSKRNNRGMWEYLESSGVLERGNDIEIKEAKKAYRKKYFLDYKRKQRSQRDAFNIDFVKDSIDYGIITQGAKRHNMSIPTLLRSATLAYLRKTFIIPDRGQLMQMEKLLAEALNQIQTIVKQKERYHWDREQKFEAIEKRIEILEKEINEFIRQPLPVEEFVKRAVAKDPTLKEQLLNILSLSLPNDNQNKNKDEPKFSPTP